MSGTKGPADRRRPVACRNARDLRKVGCCMKNVSFRANPRRLPIPVLLLAGCEPSAILVSQVRSGACRCPSDRMVGHRGSHLFYLHISSADCVILLLLKNFFGPS